MPQAREEVDEVRFGSVRPEVKADLERFVALLRQWQATHNLVSRSTLAEVWVRHVGDSLQLLTHIDASVRHCVDFGSGAGFPGLVLAIATKGEPQRRFTLIEANLKKAAFLRAAIRETGANATVAAVRIEDFAASASRSADVVTARALAPLAELCRLAAPILNENGMLLLLKGRDFVREIEEAGRDWSFDVVCTPSVTDSAGRVLSIRNLRRKVLP